MIQVAEYSTGAVKVSALRGVLADVPRPVRKATTKTRHPLMPD